MLKESRPDTAFALDGSDRHTRLRREFDALTLLAGTGVAPQPYELFEAWETCSSRRSTLTRCR